MSDIDEDEIEELIFVRPPQPSHVVQDSQGAEGSSTPDVRAPKRRSAVTLDDDDDTRATVIDKHAAKEYGEGETMRETWRKHFADTKSKDGVGGSGTQCCMLSETSLISSPGNRRCGCALGAVRFRDGRGNRLLVYQGRRERGRCEQTAEHTERE